MACSADWDKSQDWFWEGNVQERIREYMKDVEKFEIMRESDTLNKSHGPAFLANVQAFRVMSQ
jgi:hypothetical protein